LTTDPRIDGFPIWTPDGKRMIFESSRTGTFNVDRQAADGPGAVEQLTKSTNHLWPLSLSPDGTRLVIHSGSAFEGDLDLLPLDGKSQPVPLMRTPFNEDHAEVRPTADGSRISPTNPASPRFTCGRFPTSMPAIGEVRGAGDQPATSANMVVVVN
jgi:Tol biopolymer transport system component